MTSYHRISGLGTKWVILYFSTFWLGAINVLKCDLFCPIWGQSDPFWSQTGHLCVMNQHQNLYKKYYLHLIHRNFTHIYTITFNDWLFLYTNKTRFYWALPVDWECFKITCLNKFRDFNKILNHLIIMW